jgi:hypothetical protein
MSNPQRPEREAIEQALREYTIQWRGVPVDIATVADALLAALPPTPTPGWQPEDVLALIAKLDTKHMDDITPVEAREVRPWPVQTMRCSEVLLLEAMLRSLLPPAPTGERE